MYKLASNERKNKKCLSDQTGQISKALLMITLCMITVSKFYQLISQVEQRFQNQGKDRVKDCLEPDVHNMTSQFHQF